MRNIFLLAMPVLFVTFVGNNAIAREMDDLEVTIRVIESNREAKEDISHKLELPNFQEVEIRNKSGHEQSGLSKGGGDRHQRGDRKERIGDNGEHKDHQYSDEDNRKEVEEARHRVKEDFEQAREEHDEAKQDYDEAKEDNDEAREDYENAVDD